MRAVFSVVVQALTWLFYATKFRSVVATTGYHGGCYNTDVVLDCPHYQQNKTWRLLWQVYDKNESKWTNIASIRNGKQSILISNTTLSKRLTIHLNGSLEIASLHPDDETRYQCKVYGNGLRFHGTYLKISCAMVTRVEQQVCEDENVTLDCTAQKRAHPRKTHPIKWERKNTTEVLSLIVASSDSYATVSDGHKLHSNGSLLVRGRRGESTVTYTCIVGKSRTNKHIVRLKTVKCARDKPTLGTVKTTTGRVATTTPIVVTMETRSPTLPLGGASSYFGPNNIYVYLLVCFSWLVMKFNVKL